MLNVLPPPSAAINAATTFIAAVSILIRVVRAGATAVRIGANADARLAFKPLKDADKLSSEAFTSGFCFFSSPKPSLIAARSLRNRKNILRIPNAYRKMFRNPIFSVSPVPLCARLKFNTPLAAAAAPLATFLKPDVTALAAIFASCMAALRASDASRFRKLTAALPAIRAKEEMVCPTFAITVPNARSMA